MGTSTSEIQHTNYISKNPLITVFLNSFLAAVRDLLKSIDAIHLRGLDAGCGEGHMLGYLYHQGALGRLAAVDVGEDNVRYANIHYPWHDFQIADICNLPFPDNIFDYAISTEVFEHLPHPEKALIELNRVVKSRGYIIISVPFEPFFHWGNLLRGKYWYRRGYTPDHRNFWHRNQFRQFLTPYVTIESESTFKTFPWLLYGCRFK
jgi:SAM-dependent methyltransferase